jgi:hypothetical protein
MGNNYFFIFPPLPIKPLLLVPFLGRLVEVVWGFDFDFFMIPSLYKQAKVKYF